MSILDGLAGGLLATAGFFTLFLFPPTVYSIALGPTGGSMISSALAIPDKTFAKEFKATILVRDKAGKTTFTKEYNYFQKDYASHYERKYLSLRKINIPMTEAIDKFFSEIAGDIVRKVYVEPKR